MVIKRERLKVHVSSHAEMGVWDELRQHFTAYLHDVKAHYWKAMQLSFLESGERVPAEIYFAHPDVLMYYSVDPRREYVEAGCFLSQGEGTQAFQGFCERIKDALLPGYKDREPMWKPHTDTNPTFELVREEAQRLMPSEDQLSAAAALSDLARRHLLRTIYAQDSCLLESLAEGRSLMEIGPDLQLLEGLGLVQKDFVVFCRENGNQITRVGSFSQIEEATKRGFKCFSCGRPIAEERIDQLLACTPQGNILAGPNYWLGLVISRHLEKLGIRANQQLTLNTPDQRVMDIFGNYDGLLVMVEVREDAVRLDDIFLFFSRIGYYRPDLAFYLTTQPVSTEVRKYVETPCETPVVLVERPEDLEQHMREVVGRLQRERVRGVIDQLEPLTRVDVGELVYEHFFGREQHPEEVIDGPEPLVEAPEEPMRGPSMQATQGGGRADGTSKDTPSVVPVSPQEGLDVGMSHEEVTPTMDAGAANDEALAQVEATRASEKPAPAGQRDAPPVDLGLQMQMNEEVLGLDTPMIGIEEVFDLTEMVSVEKSPEEEHEQVVRRVVEDVIQNGVLGRERALLAHLGEINNMPAMTSGFVARNGLVLAEALDPETDPELTAAVASELFESVRRGLEELSFAGATRIQVDSFADRLRIRPAGEGVLLVVREERPLRESDEEFAGSLPGEMVLREAMLKKVLEDLTMVEGMRGNLVAGRDGLLIEAQLETDDVPHDVLSAVLSQMLVENEKYLQKAQLHPLRQISIRTTDALYSLIPLDREGILISLLDPSTPREVWQNRLFAAANMLTSVFQ